MTTKIQKWKNLSLYYIVLLLFSLLVTSIDIYQVTWIFVCFNCTMSLLSKVIIKTTTRLCCKTNSNYHHQLCDDGVKKWSIRHHRINIYNNSLLLSFSTTNNNSINNNNNNVFINNSNTDQSVTIGDVHVETIPLGSNRPDLVPSLVQNTNTNNYYTKCQLQHLRWMVQKDLLLQQDFLLVGPNSLARDRRHLIILYAALIQREIEYVCISSNTSDSDLKQRKEVITNTSNTNSNSSSTGTSVYINQAPVRAALNGRLLILDGIEKAERNVLPTLNNLLENRELSLDDGGLLVSSHVYDNYYNNNSESEKNSTTSTIHRVHPDFRVVALASVPANLDPPLRSRFQGRVIPMINPGELLQYIASISSHRTINIQQIKELIQVATSVPDNISLLSLCDAVNYLQYIPTSLQSKHWLINMSPTTALLPYGLGMIGVNDIKNSSNNNNDTTNSTSSWINLWSTTNDNETISTDTISKELETTTTTKRKTTTKFVETETTKLLHSLIQCAFDSGSRSVALVGPKGCYKSALVRHWRPSASSLSSSSSSASNTSTELFSLHSDITARDLLQTRGTDNNGTTIWKLTPLTRAATNGTIVILDGIDKLTSDTLTSIALLLEQGQVDLPNGQRLYVNNNFKCIALAHPSGTSIDTDWITPEIRGMFHFIRVDPLPNNELKQVLHTLYPGMDSTSLDKIIQLRDRLDTIVASGGADTVEEQESLILSLRKIKHISKRVEQRGGTDLYNLVHNTLLTSMMSDRERKIVNKCMADCNIVPYKRKNKQQQQGVANSITLDENLLTANRRIPIHPLLVPNPVFEENPGHSQILSDLLDAHAVGERALLIMGYQGVGKNRVVDYLLNKLQCEREYLQLHRDTTVQTLLSAPSVDGGRIVYGDSPLVRAAKYGRILVVDEADKAPVEVVALLKGLIEDGELVLPDGRILRYNDESDSTNSTTTTTTATAEDDNVIAIHPDFRIWALANPPGYPFHGNNLAREMADVFSCHTVPSLDSDSQRKILQRYGPNVSKQVIDKVIRIWQELRQAHETGVMVYPFSVREAVSVIKHLNQFPSDGLDGAFENVIAFDRFDSTLMKQLADTFSRHGVSVSVGRVKDEEARIQGGVSTPRTRTSDPKHGKIDENNDPHVGGNTWAGGSGGSDTAGLGGRGGPYRLDSGHPVHQVSDEMKAEVTEEAKQRARQMADDALREKLKELDMGKLDWDKYNSLHEQVAVQIQQLQVLLKDIKRRKEERVWLKRQSTGELDDSRLVDALAGEKDVFRRRGKPIDNNNLHSLHATAPISIKLVVDVSASMYRFNSYDGRLQRLLEATLMIMEALKDDDRFDLTIVGHNGDNAEILLVSSDTKQDPKTQLRILQTMVAHTQYTFAGDSTLEAIEQAVTSANDGDLVLVISDANLKRYRIDPNDVSTLMRSRMNVHTHLVLIGSLGTEASSLAKAIPNERAQVCNDTADLPLILKNIVASAAK